MLVAFCFCARCLAAGPMKIYEIDGECFSTLEGFYDEVDRVLSIAPWGHNLDAFDDVLQGGFRTPDDGFTIRWKNHMVSRRRLGYEETARQLKLRLEHCHPSNRALVSKELQGAEAHRGQTVFDWLVEIIRDHGPGGKQERNRVELVLD